MNKRIKIWLLLMKIGHLLGCHQRYDRSFFIKGYQFPLCARCMGGLIGQIVAIPAIFIVQINIFAALALTVPLIIDGSIQYFGIMLSNNIRRLITGLLCGFGLTFIYSHAINNLINLF